MKDFMIERFYDTLTQHSKSLVDELREYALTKLTLAGTNAMPSIQKSLALMAQESQAELERINQALQVLDEQGAAGIQLAMSLWCAGDSGAPTVVTADMGVQTLH